jgi:hypothetical protein
MLSTLAARELLVRQRTTLAKPALDHHPRSRTEHGYGKSLRQLPTQLGLIQLDSLPPD